MATAWWLAREGVRDVIVIEREAELGRYASGRSAGIGRQLAEDELVTGLTVTGVTHLRRLSEQVAARLRKANTAGQTVVLKLKSADFKSRTRNRKLEAARERRRQNRSQLLEAFNLVQASRSTV